jgi:hypothetical protein
VNEIPRQEKSMRVFVAGVTGALGRVLLPQLLGWRPRYPSWRDGFATGLG